MIIMEILNIDYYKPEFLIEIRGTRHREFNNAVISISLDENLENPSMLDMSIREGLKIDSQTFEWLDNPMIGPESGEEIKLYIGYANQANKFKNPIFSGRITALNPNFPSSGIPTLQVQAYDYCSCLQKSKMSLDSSVTNKTDFSEVALEIAGKHGLEPGEIDPTMIKPCENLTQGSEITDYQYLSDLAKKLDFEFFIRDKKLYFRKPRDLEPEIMTLTWGKELMSFSPRLSTANIVKEVTVTGHNPQTPKQPVKATATLSDLGPTEPKGKSGVEFIENCLKTESKIEQNLPVCNQKEAKERAIAILKKSNNNLIEGNCESIGIPSLKPGVNVAIEGVGKRFSGKYYVKSVKHSIGDGYTMSFEVRRGVVGNI
jgi:uncharacterized protein